MAASNKISFVSPASLANGPPTPEVFRRNYQQTLKWTSNLTPLNCDVYQGPDENGVVSIQELFRNEPNTSTSWIWTAHNLPNVTAGSNMHFYLYSAKDSTCDGCHANSTYFTIKSVNSASDSVLSVGLGVGLGVGIPVVVAAVIITWCIMRRRNKKAVAASSTIPTPRHGSQYGPFHGTSDPHLVRYPSYQPNTSVMKLPSDDLGGYETGSSGLKTPLAEADADRDPVELPLGAQGGETGYQTPKAELEASEPLSQKGSHKR